MTHCTAAVLEPLGDARVALESVDVRASLRGLLSEVVVTQVYCNLEDSAIEAVYTFPLPLEAVLLDLSLELNGKRMRGVVQPRAAAGERYEEAIADGDSAVLLEQVEPGLFTVNVGNLLAGERAVVRFRYGLLHRWQGSDLRIHLPTTIAPRYGDPAGSGLEPHQVPEHCLTADHGFSLDIAIEGELAGAEFESPSHPVVITERDGVRHFSLSGGAVLMDRDFVLLLKEPAGSTPEVLWAEDGGETVMLAAFHPTGLEGPPAAPRCVTLVVDCSGSMGGDSISQARVALHDILGLLQPTDRFNLITFGSYHHALFPAPVMAGVDSIRTAAEFIGQMHANMGGTEIGRALEAAYATGRIDGLLSDVLLITDGEVWEQEALIAAAKRSGYRVFTVGVGSAVSEAFVRGLAAATAGACELVSPREQMAARIVRHFQRIDQPMATRAEVLWGREPIRQIPEPVGTVFAGDTLHVFGWHSGVCPDPVELAVTLADGRTIHQSMTPAPEPVRLNDSTDTLTRIAAYQRLDVLDQEAATELAVRYQLVTAFTSCVLVFERPEEEKSDTVPALRKVPQVLAAGWGGLGTVGAGSRLDGMVFSEPMPPHSMASCMSIDAFLADNGDRFVSLVAALNSRYPESTDARLDIGTVAALAALGLEEDVADGLFGLIGEAAGERAVVVAFLVVLAGSTHGDGLSRHVKRLIRKAGRTLSLQSDLTEAVTDLLDATETAHRGSVPDAWF